MLIENENAWITEQLYLLYLKSTIGNLIYDDKNIRFALIHDKCTSHKAPSVTQYLKKINVKEF